MTEIQKLLDTMRALRDSVTGCPWDKQQTFQSIAPYTIEEAYEVVDAIESGDMDALCSELGDLLLQVVYHSEIASEKNHFSFSNVVTSINSKLIDRHPHVFGSTKINTAEEQSDFWETKKTIERNKQARNREENVGVLTGVSKNLPALTRAHKLQKRAARVGFDWTEVTPVFDKLEEEIAEIRQVMNDVDNKAKLTEELGDLLFVCVNLARHFKVDAESALRMANNKFVKRFEYIEKKLLERQKTPENATLDEMDRLWDEAKLKGNSIIE